jgi:hypothetical protein
MGMVISHNWCPSRPLRFVLWELAKICRLTHFFLSAKARTYKGTLVDRILAA